MKSEDVIYHGSCVRVSNNNARGWMLRDQLNNYRRNLSWVARSVQSFIDPANQIAVGNVANK